MLKLELKIVPSKDHQWVVATIQGKDEQENMLEPIKFAYFRAGVLHQHEEVKRPWLDLIETAGRLMIESLKEEDAKAMEAAESASRIILPPGTDVQ